LILTNQKQTPTLPQSTVPIIAKDEKNMNTINMVKQTNMSVTNTIHKNTNLLNKFIPTGSMNISASTLNPNPSMNQNQILGIENALYQMNSRLSNFENRLYSSEKETQTNSVELKDLKSSLNSNFSRLDTILEKVASKLH